VFDLEEGFRHKHDVVFSVDSLDLPDANVRDSVPGLALTFKDGFLNPAVLAQQHG